MYYTKLISLLPLFFYVSSCKVTEEKKSKLLSDYIIVPNVGHEASDGQLWCDNEIDEHASGEDEIQEDVKFQRDTETKALELGRGSHNYMTKIHVPDGWEKQNPNDPIYIQLAEESLQKYVSDSVDKKPHTLLRVVMVTTQVVSGSMIRIDFVAASYDNDRLRPKNCHSKIWEQPWLNKKEINVSCEVDNHRLRRQILGESIKRNLNDPIYIQLAEESLQKYVSDSVDKKPYLLLEVEIVVITISVSGTLTRITFFIVSKDNQLGLVKKCHSRIWEQPLLNRKDIAVKCAIDIIRSRKHVWIGGWHDEDPNDPIYIQLAEESLQKYVSDSLDKKPHTLLQVEKVITQVVAGLNTRINFVAAPDDNLHYAKKCYSEIFEQGWINKKEIEVSCAYDPSWRK